MDLNKLEKIFCENVLVGYGPEAFVLVLKSGDEDEAYAVTPAHAKRIAQHITHQVAEYEKQFGTIDTAWDPNVKSPIQVKGSPENGA